MSKISDLPVLTTAKGKAYIPVVDPSEALAINQNKRILLSTLTAGADNTNFSPYNPATTYSNAGPDFVSYNSNVYEYINATPAAGKTPATEAVYWQIVSAGRFTHPQNTDAGTNSATFDIGDPQGQEQEGYVLLRWRINGAGRVIAEGIHYDLSQTPELFERVICYNYTGTGSDVWEDLYALPANVALLNVQNDYTAGALFKRSDPAHGIITTFVPNIGDTHTRFTVNMNGKAEHGSGLAPVDVSFERQDAGRYRVNGKLNATVELQEAGVSLAIKYGKVFKTGTVVDFVAAETYFGTLTTFETTNITANLTGAIVGNMAFMFHENGTEPTFGAEFNRLPHSRDYQLGQTNRIIFHYLGGTTIDYVIQ